MNDTFSFLRAPRFYVMLAGALSIYAQAKGWIGEPEMVFIATVSAIFVGVKTLDRFGDKKVEAAIIAQIPSNEITFSSMNESK